VIGIGCVVVLPVLLVFFGQAFLPTFSVLPLACSDEEALGVATDQVPNLVIVEAILRVFQSTC
jgi:hypothetical protein